jgi:hypothetical protein
MEADPAKYRQLDPEQIIVAVRTLHERIDRRFPGSGLGKLASELLHVAQEGVTRSRWIRKRNLPLQFAAGCLGVAIVCLLGSMLLHIRQYRVDDYVNFIQAFESTVSSVVFIGAAVLFLSNWETRLKRDRALRAIHELRAMAHIVDMHQLTKHAERHLFDAAAETVQIKRPLTPFEMNRYLDYCSESLALISKIAALYVQGFQDPVLLDAVDDVEDLTAGLSRKIWQKITILESIGNSLSNERPNSDGQI